MKKIILVSLFLLSIFYLKSQTFFGNQNIIMSTEARGPFSVYASDLDGDNDLDIMFAAFSGDRVAWKENIDGNGNFGKAEIISDIGNPTCVFACDIDNDGDNDVLSAHRFADKIVWFENTDGSGTFGDQHIISTSVDSPESIYACDIDGDGDFDVLSASAADNKIAWYENTDGLGNFGSQQIITITAYSVNSVYSCDIDGDGDFDVLSASAADNKIAWYKNTDGFGNFGDQQVITISANGASSVYACDIDGDDDNDVLSASNTDGKIAWYENTDGNGTFGEQQIIYTSANNYGANVVYACDIDGDGDQDVLSGIAYESGISWYENTDGIGSFSEQKNISTNVMSPQSIYTGDIDGDGDIDVMSASFEDSKISLYENTDGQGNFGEQIVLTPSITNPTSARSGDIDNDGDQDVLSASSQDDKIAWYENTDGIGEFGEQKVICDSAMYAVSVYAANIDSDGLIDVISASQNDGKIAWYKNTDGLGNFGEQQIITDTEEYISTIYPCDLDSDGDNDILCSTVDDKVSWYINLDGNGNFSSEQIIAVTADGPYSVHAADIDGDGDLDIISASKWDHKIAWYENTDGLGNFGNENIISNTASFVASVFSCDLDTDGDNDVLTATNSMSEDKISWFENIDGAGGFGDEQIIDNSENINSIYASDIDNDGDIDILMTDDEENKLVYYINEDGSGNFGNEQIISDIEEEPKSVYVCDIDGDGDQDVITSSKGSSPQYSKVVWYENAPAPIIIWQPENKSICNNSNTIFQITANYVFDYIWQIDDASGFTDLENNSTYSGVNTDILQISNATNDMEGRLYRCIISNPTDTLISNHAVLTFIEDVESPIITSSHYDQIISAGNNCDSNLPDYTVYVTAYDNCDTNIDITQSPVAGTIISGPINEVFLTATDDDGNYDEVSFNVEVVDNTNPVITSVHTDQTMGDGIICEIELPDYTGDVAAIDNCDSELNITQTPNQGTIVSGLTNTVTLKVTDDVGNYDEAIFNVEVTDNTDPTITCIEYQVVMAGEDNTYTIQGTEFDPVLTEDNCSSLSVINDFNVSSKLDGAKLPLGLTEIIWTVEDEAGNTKSCNFYVFVNDYIGINNKQHKNITISPNPTYGKFTVQFEEVLNFRSVKLQITDVSGKILIEKINVLQTEVIDMSGFSNGTYIISIQTDKEILKSKIIKE